MRRKSGWCMVPPRHRKFVMHEYVHAHVVRQPRREREREREQLVAHSSTLVLDLTRALARSFARTSSERTMIGLGSGSAVNFGGAAGRGSGNNNTKAPKERMRSMGMFLSN